MQKSRWISSLFACALCCLTSIATTGSPPAVAVQPTIIGGSDGSIADVPWQVLFIIEDSAVCGGSLVSPTQIVSAAHCFTDVRASDVDAWAGVTSMSERPGDDTLAIADVTIHPDYDPTTFANDLALVRLARPVPARLGATSIGLPADQDVTWPESGSSALISGWGEVTVDQPAATDVLQVAAVQIMASPGAESCGEYGTNYLPSKQICAGQPGGGVDACSGDSGGPLTMYVDGEPILAGIASTGFGCGRAGYPGLYVRTTSYLTWLSSNGVDVTLEGGTAWVDTPGSDKDGEPADFRVGFSYPASEFATIAGLKPRRAKITSARGRSCIKVGKSVLFTKPGRCVVKIRSGEQTARLIITTYPT